MNNRITRFFQGLTLTTFSPVRESAYNTINNIKSKNSVKEQQDTLSSICTEVKSNAVRQEIWQNSITDKIDLLKNKNLSNVQVESIETAEKTLCVARSC